MKEIITIDLLDSSNARSFKKDNIIHQQSLIKVRKFLEEFHISDKKYSTKGKAKLPFKHNTVTILGTRGSGKTSFLLSIEDLLDDKKDGFPDLLFLDIIDPTLVEEKGHVFLNVISVICDQVKDALSFKQVNTSEDVQCIKKNWKESLNRLAKGLPSIDGIGGNKFGEWQDPEFVMNNELMGINSARKLALYFAQFVENSLEILNKKQFVLCFDDIDVDSTKGYTVLETIRKYFISDHIITFLSGDLKLYDALVREKKWSNFGKNLINYETSKLYQEEDRRRVNMRHYNDMVTDLTSQYLIKIMQPRYRIHLATLYDYYNGEYNIYVKKHDSDKRLILLRDFLNNLFSRYGVKSNLQMGTFIEFLLKQPLRTVVHFLYYFKDDNNTDNADFISVFLSDLYEKHIDINTLQSSTTYFLPTILSTLLQEKKLTESYQLIPSTLDNSLNAALFTGGLLFSHHLKKGSKFLIFEYFLKIAYLRNFSEKEKNERNLLPLINAAGFLTDSVFRDTANRIQCSLYGYFDNLKLTEFGLLPLYGLSKIAKTHTEDSVYRIDYILDNSNINSIRRMVGYIPCFIGQYSKKQSSNVFYSVISLLSTIGEICKRYENALVSSNNIFGELSELSQLRYYTVNDEKFNRHDEEEEEEEKKERRINERDYSDEDISRGASFFNTILRGWINTKIAVVSPYLLGKIFTRFYFSLKGIDFDKFSLGEVFNLQIVSFFNAAIVEEARELGLSLDLNNNNIQTTDRVFINNLKKVINSKMFSSLNFSQWIMSCPLLLLYVDKNVYNSVSSVLRNNIVLTLENYNNFEVSTLLNNAMLNPKFRASNNDKVRRILRKNSRSEASDKAGRLSPLQRNNKALAAIKDELEKNMNEILDAFSTDADLTKDQVDKFFKTYSYELKDFFKSATASSRKHFVNRCISYLRKKKLNK